jgi:hypothetical protein
MNASFPAASDQAHRQQLLRLTISHLHQQLEQLRSYNLLSMRRPHLKMHVQIMLAISLSTIEPNNVAGGSRNNL